MYTSVTIIFSPYHVGIRDHRVGDGPNRILKLGLVEELQKLKLDVTVREIEAIEEIGELGRSDYEGDIGRSFEILRRTSIAVSEARKDGSFPLILSGNCMATVAAVCGLNIDDLAYVYFDAHDDFENPDTNTTGYIDGMGLSILNGTAFKALRKTIPGFKPRNFSKFLYCGLREVADGQAEVYKNEGMEVVWGDKNKKVDFVAELKKKLDQKKFTETVVHMDLDVLDESEGKVNGFESPGGLSGSDLVECMSMVPELVQPVSLTVCSFNPNLGDGDKIAGIAVRATVAFFTRLLKNDK